MKKTNQKTLNIFKSSKFIPEKYREDLKNVEEEYKSIGYRDAKVVSDTVITVDPNTLEIVVTIEEGKPYYLGDITFTGNSVFSTEVLERVFRSEEHTSELQSRGHLVCRLLLEKKKQINRRT